MIMREVHQLMVSLVLGMFMSVGFCLIGCGVVQAQDDGADDTGNFHMVL